MNKPANDDSISRVFPKKTNLCFLEALGSLRFLLGRGCPRLGQPIEKPISPRPSGTGIFLYSRMPALKAPAYFQSASPRRERSGGLFSKRFSEAPAAIERSRLDFVKAIFFQPEANPFKHRQLFFQVPH